jgi:hypothetical protein
LFFNAVLLMYHDQEGGDEIQITAMEFDLLYANMVTLFDKIPKEVPSMLLTKDCLPEDHTASQSRFPFCKEMIPVKDAYKLGSDFKGAQKFESYDSLIPVLPRSGSTINDTKLLARSVLSGTLRFQLSVIHDLEPDTCNWEVLNALFSVPAIQSVSKCMKLVRAANGEPAAGFDRALHVAVPRAGAVRTRVRNVVGAAEHAAKPVAKSVATHLLQSKPVAIHLLRPRDGFRVALRGGQREVLAGEEQPRRNISPSSYCAAS